MWIEKIALTVAIGLLGGNVGILIGSLFLHSMLPSSQSNAIQLRTGLILNKHDALSHLGIIMLLALHLFEAEELFPLQLI